MKECEVHPKFLESESKSKKKTVRCSICNTSLLIKRKDKFTMGDLPPVTIEFKIGELDLKHNIKDGKWNGYPDEFYIGKNLTLFKHGNTMAVEKNRNYKENITWEDFTPLWITLLNQHKGDELMQTYFLEGGIKLGR